jgi:hypothetical protein
MMRWPGAKDRASSDTHLLALVVSLKCFQRLGYPKYWRALEA